MLLDLLKIYNGPITWDMLYHPRLLIVYQYFHYITFIFTSFLSLLTGYIILKKSNEMGFYKYILLNSLLWNYFLDIIYFLYSPVNLFPYPVFYSEGVLNFLPPNAFIGFLYCFGFGIFGVLQSNSIALIYRVSLVFINSKFYDMVNDPKQYRILYVALLAFFEGMWSIPFCTFIFQPYNSSAALSSIIKEAPIYANFVSLEPSTSGCDYGNSCYPFVLLLIICAGISSTIFFYGGLILYALYFMKIRKLESSMSTETKRLNKILFRALSVNALIMAVTWFIPGALIAVVVSMRLEYSNFITQICMFFPLLYPIFEMMAMLYFITPYREFIKSVLKGVLLKLGLNRVIPQAQPTWATPVQGLHI